MVPVREPVRERERQGDACGHLKKICSYIYTHWQRVRPAALLHTRVMIPHETARREINALFSTVV